MLDLFLSLASPAAQVQLFAQSSTVYLPISTTQSSRPNCITYTATNATGNTVRDIYVNRRNSKGKTSKSFLASSLKTEKTLAFDICDNTFVNVEARQ